MGDIGEDVAIVSNCTLGLARKHAILLSRVLSVALPIFHPDVDVVGRAEDKGINDGDTLDIVVWRKLVVLPGISRKVGRALSRWAFQAIAVIRIANRSGGTVLCDSRSPSLSRRQL